MLTQKVFSRGWVYKYFTYFSWGRLAIFRTLFPGRAEPVELGHDGALAAGARPGTGTRPSRDPRLWNAAPGLQVLIPTWSQLNV